MIKKIHNMFHTHIPKMAAPMAQPLHHSMNEAAKAATNFKSVERKEKHNLHEIEESF